jgi:hypothetical protein
MATKKKERTAAEILNDISELMGLINVECAWYKDMDSYSEIQAKKPAKVGRRAQLAAEQPKQKTK